MKFDFLSSIGVAIVGMVIGFLIVNAIVPSLQDYPIKTIDPSTDGTYNYATYDTPNDEVFNYDSLNPTVEVYIGNCEEFDENGACKQVTTTNVDIDEEDENTEEDENGEEIDEDLEYEEGGEYTEEDLNGEENV